MLMLLIVGTGGFFGTVFRYLLNVLIQKNSLLPSIPLGTLTVNVLGCFLIGFLGGLMEAKQLLNQGLRLLLFIGFLGGFTTYSAFSYETFGFMKSGALLSTLSNVGLHLFLGVGAVWIGTVLSNKI
ncbi:MAG: fluoride efflux transporter CrcB [FCB group bacterium]|nr:fluoride efflux transporter CrcB [FCB group bacterium]